MEDRQTKLVMKLYDSTAGRLLLKIITRPWFSKLAGRILDSSVSRLAIGKFITRNNIDMNEYPETEYISFNDFFTRKIKSSLRPVNMDWKALIAPCDGRLSISPITGSGRFDIKGHEYTLEELIHDKDLAREYIGGSMLIFRLTVSDYHRYHYPDSGIKSGNTHIPGVLHTVNPVAAGRRRIYCENSREYFTLQSDNFGKMLMIQVGALLVGRIFNKHNDSVVVRGLEAGWFEYGGSTVILCLKPGVAMLNEDIRIAASQHEVPVKMGEPIGICTLR